jgi:hypothetical protein
MRRSTSPRAVARPPTLPASKAMRRPTQRSSRRPSAQVCVPHNSVSILVSHNDATRRLWRLHRGRDVTSPGGSSAGHRPARRLPPRVDPITKPTTRNATPCRPWGWPGSSPTRCPAPGTTAPGTGPPAGLCPAQPRQLFTRQGRRTPGLERGGHWRRAGRRDSQSRPRAAVSAVVSAPSASPGSLFSSTDHLCPRRSPLVAARRARRRAGSPVKM